VSESVHSLLEPIQPLSIAVQPLVQPLEPLRAEPEPEAAGAPRPDQFIHSCADWYENW